MKKHLGHVWLRDTHAHELALKSSQHDAALKELENGHEEHHSQTLDTHQARMDTLGLAAGRAQEETAQDKN